MQTDKFTQIKTAVADLIESACLPAYPDRYLEVTEQRFAMVYFGEWSEEPTTLEETEVKGTLSVEVFAMNDNELSKYSAQIRPLLKNFEDDELFNRFIPEGGEYPPQENGIRPSVILNYSVSFYEV